MEPALPPGWVKALSSEHQRYYWFDTATGASQWMPPPPPDPDAAAEEPSRKRPRPSDGPPRVAVIVPFRDLHVAQKRAEHLRKFAPHMHAFLGGDASGHKVFIIEQSDDGLKFNRGKLLNIGFDIAAREGFDLFVFHDVDLLPHRALAPLYMRDPGEHPLHIAGLWDRYSDNPRYCGGIVNFSRAQFRRINGFPNFFWGWGGEDDEMYLRVEAVGMRFKRPAMPPDFPKDQAIIEDLEGMNIEAKMSFLRQHSDWKCMIKRELLAEHAASWRSNGLADLRYAVAARDDAHLGGACVKVTVELGLNDHEYSDYKANINVKD
uniref:WW domain-containing protein n=1 Tax=Phaeomonas parva TaxID=124430 RepID=A0A6U4I093_9STRA|mmetsp:Transcript_38384/g.120328  ORF Transcript_38384/g.120328 Transcript_38384/m.120328 type:complete len:320 (+) Transcript_38384:88-1047(+)|eukprot:CAMPEP_0118883066 /NCGR_PEP_ID=MMETSP1163-20130328/22200_1 /TAXON_ID=124430 /ORGANISM="Phaeomonas parva, Strain CCMP2877" /LENGTH=319 /DNA_ID=CAMNT_0006820353 /DNA_START=56 /DNA_END=1015 /DNA_ORIENTATION=+